MADGYVFKVIDDAGVPFFNYVVWESDLQNAIDAVKKHSHMKSVTKVKDLDHSDLLGFKENLYIGASIDFNKGNFVLLSVV